MGLIPEGWTAHLWIVFTLVAAGGQTLRNVMQRSLTSTLGTVGATHVRFLFGLPFAALAWLLLTGVASIPPMKLGAVFWSWIVIGALAQIAGTAFMLSAMRTGSFVSATACLKTEPVQVALFGAVCLGERLGWIATGAVVFVTTGVLLISARATKGAGGTGAAQAARWAPVANGLVSAAAFALAAVGFRGAVLALGEGWFVAQATLTLLISLTVQTLALSGWLAVRARQSLVAIVRAWRPSLLAGLLGWFSSQMWFLAFALESAAKVRTVALVEILFAHLVSRRLYAQRVDLREGVGLALIAIGVVVLINT